MADVIELELETDENGELHLTKEQLGAEPHKRYRVRVEPQTAASGWGPRWADMTPEERAKDFETWLEHFKDNDAPALSDWAVSRDTMYD